MGMFDEIVVHRKLPLPKELPEELRGVKWKEVVFQTKCLENCLANYKIAVNGRLYTQKFEDKGNLFAYHAFFDEKRKESEMFWENVPTPTSINFYTNFQKKKFDYWVSFTALFDPATSKLVKIQLDQLDKEDNTERKKQQKLFEEEAAASEKRQKKFIYKIYNIFWKKPLRYFFGKVSKIANKLPSTASKIERKVLPW
jgi:hypothetical protein